MPYYLDRRDDKWELIVVAVTTPTVGGPIAPPLGAELWLSPRLEGDCSRVIADDEFT